MVRCQNPARAGPFGGCVPVQMAGAAGNATNTAAENTTDAAAAVGSSAATATVTATAPEATGTQLVNSAKFRRVAAAQDHDIEEDDAEYDEEFDE